MASLMPNGKQQFFTSSGKPLSSGKLYTYAAGTSTPKATYSDAAGLVLNANPIILDARGEALVYWSGSYKIGLQDSLSGAIYTVDNYVTDQASTALSTISAPSGAALVGVIAAGAGSVSRTAQNKLRDSVSVRDFGAVGDGITDDTTALQSAINYGGKINIPTGIYLYSSLTIASDGCWLCGSGNAKSILKCTTTSGTAILVGNATTVFSSMKISSIGLDTVASRSISSATIYTLNSHNVTFEDLKFTNTHGYCIWNDGGASQFITYIKNIEINSAYVGLGFGISVGLVQDVWVSDCIISGCNYAGVRAVNASGIYFSNLDIISCGTGVLIEPASGKEVKGCFFSQVLADTCTSNGWAFAPLSGGKIDDINMVGCWGATTVSASGAGLLFAATGGTTKNISISSFRSVNNRGHGIIVQAGNYLTFMNCHSSANGQQASNTYDAINIGTSIADFSIIGGVYGGDDGLPAQQRYGINIGTGCSSYIVVGNDLKNNVTSTMLDAGTASAVIGNVGYLTSRSALVSTGPGVSSFTVTHGLSFTPNSWEILIAPATSPSASGIVSWWVSAATATTFTITMNAATTSTLYFSWFAKKSES